MDSHTITAMPEPHRIDGKTVTRYRGRCSCSHQTFMHYATAEAARTAVNRTHIVSIKGEK